MRHLVRQLHARGDLGAGVLGCYNLKVWRLGLQQLEPPRHGVDIPERDRDGLRLCGAEPLKQDLCGGLGRRGVGRGE